jgi:hypothetical protein
VLIEGIGSLIEHQKGWILVQSASEANSLPLASREPQSSFADLGVVAVRQLADDEIVNLGDPSGPFYGNRIDLLHAEGDVLGH